MPECQPERLSSFCSPREGGNDEGELPHLPGNLPDQHRVGDDGSYFQGAQQKEGDGGDEACRGAQYHDGSDLRGAGVCVLPDFCDMFFHLLRDEGEALRQVTSDSEGVVDSGEEINKGGAFLVVGRAGFACAVDQLGGVDLVDAQEAECQHRRQHQEDGLLADYYQADQAEGDEGAGDFAQSGAGALGDDLGIHADAPFPFSGGSGALLFGAEAEKAAQCFMIHSPGHSGCFSDDGAVEAVLAQPVCRALRAQIRPMAPQIQAAGAEVSLSSVMSLPKMRVEPVAASCAMSSSPRSGQGLHAWRW